MTTQVRSARATLEYVKTIGIVNNAAKGRGFANPFDVTFGSGGRIFVLNRGMPAFSRVGVVNLEEDYLYEFGDHGDDEGEFRLGTGITIDASERIYVAEEQNHRVNVFQDDGKFVGRWGSPGSGDGEFDGPAGIAVDADGNLLVVDQNNHRVQKFTNGGAYLGQWGGFGSGDGQLNMPWGIWVDSNNDVWVADWRNDRVQKFDADGAHLASYGESGEGDGQFSRPSGVCVDREGYIYVADWGNQRLKLLDPDGAPLVNEKGQATLSQWAEEYLDANPEERVARDQSNLWPELPEHLRTPLLVSTQTEAYFWGPSAVKLDNDERLYVVEAPRHRIQVYKRSGA